MPGYKKGKLIVLDGTDGTGKATQADLLTQKMKEQGYEVRMISFPQYNTKSAGPVEEYLSGKYGQAEEVDPYIASTFYAVDRFDAGFKIKRWLEAGYIVLSNRYVTANMGHQGNKLSSAAERKRFFNWLYNLEYKIFNIPKPDINIILHLRAELAQELAQKRTSADWEGKTNDIHQDNLEHLKKAERIFLEIAETFPEFHLIRCTDNDKILAREEILELIWGKVKE
ncbi:MAG: dTMP kinase, partial [Patescibacteria group bacterium]